MPASLEKPSPPSRTLLDRGEPMAVPTFVDRVVLRVAPDVTTLVDYHHSPVRKAEHGGHGAGGHRNGTHGADLVLPVPDGTVVMTEAGEVLADLVGAGTEVV